MAVLGVPAVQAPLVHALALEALQLAAEHVVLHGRALLGEAGQAVGGQEGLHQPWGGKHSRTTRGDKHD